MKRSFLLIVALLLPAQPIWAQQLDHSQSDMPPKITNTWLSRISNNFTKLPSWATDSWFTRIPKSTWVRINKLFGGFKIQTFFGAVQLESQCVELKRHIATCNVALARENACESLLGMIQLGDDGMYRFADKHAFMSEFFANAWLGTPPSFDVDTMRAYIQGRKNEIEDQLSRLKQLNEGVKRYIETGENICDKVPGPLKIVLLGYRDILGMMLLIIGVVMGIAFSPEIYRYYKNRLFKTQPSQQDVPIRAEAKLQQAEVARRQIIADLGQREDRVRDNLYSFQTVQAMLDAGTIFPNDILFIAESDDKAAEYFRRNLEQLIPGRDGITQIGILASTPYIKDENRMIYIQRLLDSGVVPTDQDQELLNLLREKTTGVGRRVKSAAKR